MPVEKGKQRDRRRIHWAWVPAAIFSVVVGSLRYGWLTTVLLILAGLSLAGYAEWRAWRRRQAV